MKNAVLMIAILAAGAGSSHAEEPAKGGAEFLFVNGGDNYQSARPEYEEYIKLFVELSPAGSKPTVLNAGGADTKRLKYQPDGTIARDANGWYLSLFVSAPPAFRTVDRKSVV